MGFAGEVRRSNERSSERSDERVRAGFLAEARAGKKGDEKLDRVGVVDFLCAREDGWNTVGSG